MSDPRVVPTRAERFLLARRRMGWNQENAASRLGLSTRDYARLERGELSRPRLRAPRLGRVRRHERCLLLRRRARVSQAEVAREIGRSRWWVNQMERGQAPVDDLVWYWEA